MGSGLYNPLLMATPVGGASKNEINHLQFKARMANNSTHNLIAFVGVPESATRDGPRIFRKIFATGRTRGPGFSPFKPEFNFQQRALMEGNLKKVQARLITSMPTPTVSMWLWKTDTIYTPGDRVAKIFSFPVPTMPDDLFTFPTTGFVDIRLEKDRYYYWCWEFDDLIPRFTNFGIQVTTDIWWGNGPVV